MKCFVESEHEASYINKIDRNDIAPYKVVNGFFQHMDKVLKDIDFIKDDRPMISRKINHIFLKSQPIRRRSQYFKGYFICN